MKKLHGYLIAGVVLLGAGMIVWAVSSGYLHGNNRVTASYMACGCGGCGGVEPTIKYVDSTAEYDRLVARDQALKDSKDCITSGCSLCTEYQLRKG